MRKKMTNNSYFSLCRLILLAAMLFLSNNFANANSTQNLLILGDSLSAGYGINTGKEWAALLSRQLKRSHPPIQVINASISGETTSGALARLPAILASTRPKWVLIALGSNDGLRGQSLQAMKKNLNDIITLIRQHGGKPLLAGMYLPPNYGKVFNTRFHQVFENLAKENHLPFLPFLMKGVGGNRKLMQKDGLHPNEEAQEIIFQTVWKFLEKNLQT